MKVSREWRRVPHTQDNNGRPGRDTHFVNYLFWTNNRGTRGYLVRRTVWATPRASFTSHRWVLINPVGARVVRASTLRGLLAAWVAKRLEGNA